MCIDKGIFRCVTHTFFGKLLKNLWNQTINKENLYPEKSDCHESAVKAYPRTDFMGELVVAAVP